MASNEHPAAQGRLRCSVCGEEPGWSLPREGDPCWNDDGGKLVRDHPAASSSGLGRPVEAPSAGVRSVSASPDSPAAHTGFAQYECVVDDCEIVTEVPASELPAPNPECPLHEHEMLLGGWRDA